MKFQDTIEAVSKKETRKKGTWRFAFKMTNKLDEDGKQLWISILGDEDDEFGNSLSKGDECAFTCVESGGFVNLESAEKIVSQDTPAETGIKTESTQKSLPPTSKDDLIVRQVCLKCAQASLDPLAKEVGDKDFDDKLQSHLDSVKKLMCGYYKIFTGKDW